MLSTRARSLHLATAMALVATPVLLAAPWASAVPGGKGTEKVLICHRTNSMTNPYVAIEVAVSSVDGSGGKGDHYLNHTGPVWTPSASKATGWGDIIPPIPGVHGGLNWDSGASIYSAGCKPTLATDTDGDRIPDVIDIDEDGDGTPDISDPDDDNDGTPDATDPDESYTTDTDDDDIPDSVDSDDDGDGTRDDDECVKSSTDPAALGSSGTEVTEEPTGTASSDAPDAAGASDTAETIDGAATGSGQDDTAAVATRAESCRPAGSEGPQDDQADTDGDRIPNGTDPDDDGDGTPDVSDPDEDGDGIPDVSDPDDDGDRVPDETDPDDPAPNDPSVVDTDGDRTPDVTDRDDDGDGVRDPSDSDADGNGQPETREQVLPAASLPASIEPGTEVVLLDQAVRTSAGQRATAEVECSPAARSVVSRVPTGDVRGQRLCDVTKQRGAVRLKVVGGQPTIVSVRVYAPASGEYRALDEITTYRVR